MNYDARTRTLKRTSILLQKFKSESSYDLESNFQKIKTVFRCKILISKLILVNLN